MFGVCVRVCVRACLLECFTQVGVVAVLAVSESVSDFKSVLDLSDRYA